ncbi:tripartite tricarboxylate transporter TctB family protein [Halomonas sp. ANAO-440]|uniref:tripartite tricarboxylate transporter TctB family protein n=1 Tax=Halomonas sp. ANAO-440 TaxID=2861360 RepID=UPI001CAA4EE7|nr:tripartite tricarboxylate transporter TctB family protein [Halomonas sp. ANAO-440]MBZ0331006.1 tripartite tricarboxylate transporter TctB family protein [Halomonas sp. ANAO-440]
MFASVSSPSGLWRDLAVALVALFFGIGGWFWTQQFPARAMLWPNIIFITMALIGVGYTIFLLQRTLVVGRRNADDAKPIDEAMDEETPSGKQRLILMSIVAITTIGYLFTFPLVGFYSATFLFLIVVPLILGYRNSRWIIGYSTITALLLWLVFGLLLNRSLPAEFFL